MCRQKRNDILTTGGMEHKVYIALGSNLGNRKRMMKSYLVSLSYSFISGAVLGGLLLAFGTQFLSFFANEPIHISNIRGS